MVQPHRGLPGDCSVAVEDCAANPGRPRCWRGSPEAHHRRVGSRTASTSSEESPSRPQAPAAAGGEPFSALFRWLSGAVTPREARTTTPFAQTFLSRSQNSIATGQWVESRARRGGEPALARSLGCAGGVRKRARDAEAVGGRAWVAMSDVGFCTRFAVFWCFSHVLASAVCSECIAIRMLRSECARLLWGLLPCDWRSDLNRKVSS